MSSNITMEDLVRPNRVEGLNHYVETCYDAAEDIIKVSQVHFWVRYLKDAQSLSVKRVTLSDGVIRDAGAENFEAAWAATKNLATNPTKTAEDLVAQLAGLEWGRTILKQAYGL